MPIQANQLLPMELQLSHYSIPKDVKGEPLSQAGMQNWCITMRGALQGIYLTESCARLSFKQHKYRLVVDSSQPSWSLCISNAILETLGQPASSASGSIDRRCIWCAALAELAGNSNLALQH